MKLLSFLFFLFPFSFLFPFLFFFLSTLVCQESRTSRSENSYRHYGDVVVFEDKLMTEIGKLLKLTVSR